MRIIKGFILGVLCLSLSGFIIYRLFPNVICNFAEKLAFARVNLELKKIKIDGEVFSFAEGGKGDTVVFVHGFQGNKQFWLNYSRCFVSTHHLVLPDLPAHGGSSYKSDQKFDLKSLAKVLHSFIEAKGLKKFYLVGTSLGAGVVTEYAALYPERLCKLILLNPIGVKPEDEEEYLRVIKRNEEMFFPSNFTELDNLYVYLMGRPFTKSKIFKRYTLNYLVKNKLLFKKVFREIAKSDGVQNILPNITIPTLVMIGKKDNIARPYDLEIYSKMIPDCKTILVEEGYHVFEKKPYDQAIFEIKRFICE